MRAWGAMLAVGSLGLLALPACSGSGGVQVSETPVDVDEYDSVAGVAPWNDGLVAVSAEGAVFRSDDGRRWTTLRTTGLEGDADEGQTLVRRDIAGIAANDDFLLAAGTRSVQSGSEDAVFAPSIWRSDDGERWEQLDISGLTARYIDTVVFHDGAFLVFGSEEIPTPPGVETDEDEEEDAEAAEAGEPDTIEVTSIWRSADGEQWERIGENLLPPGENSSEAVAAVGADGDQLLASFGVECSGCFDDFAFVLSKSDDAGETWSELDPSGLDDIELANTDVIPRVVSFDGEFVAVGTSGESDTKATLWRSTDGRRWTDETALGGPTIEAYAESIDAVTTTDDGVVALELAGDTLIAWRVHLA